MIGICEKCSGNGKVVIHHKDGNHFNDVPSNRQPLCYRCHLVAHGRADIGMGARNDRLSIGWHPPSIEWAEVKRQYQACFPRS